MHQLQRAQEAGAAVKLILYEAFQLRAVLWVLQRVHCWRCEVAADQVLALRNTYMCLRDACASALGSRKDRVAPMVPLVRS